MSTNREGGKKLRRALASQGGPSEAGTLFRKRIRRAYAGTAWAFVGPAITHT